MPPFVGEWKRETLRHWAFAVSAVALVHYFPLDQVSSLFVSYLFMRFQSNVHLITFPPPTSCYS